MNVIDEIRNFSMWVGNIFGGGVLWWRCVFVNGWLFDGELGLGISYFLMGIL